MCLDSTCSVSWSTPSLSCWNRDRDLGPTSANCLLIGQIGWRWRKTLSGPRSQSWLSAVPCSVWEPSKETSLFSCTDFNMLFFWNTHIREIGLKFLLNTTGSLYFQIFLNSHLHVSSHSADLYVRSWLGSAGYKVPGLPGKQDTIRPPLTPFSMQKIQILLNWSQRRQSGFGLRYNQATNKTSIQYMMQNCMQIIHICTGPENLFSLVSSHLQIRFSYRCIIKLN